MTEFTSNPAGMLKRLLRPLFVTLTRFGINPVAMLTLRYLPRYFAESREFRALGGRIVAAI
jgi:hypothetical protein